MKRKEVKISRYTVLNIIMLAIFGLITLRLIYLQVYKHSDYKERADVGSTRFISENAPRGKIYDSNGNILATNNQTYTLTYTETKEAEERFYETMDNVFTILSDNGEVLQDDLLLKIDANGKFYYDFKTDDPATRKAVEKRFKRDRGLNESVEKDLFKNQKDDLTDAQIEMVDAALLKITPENTFYELVKIYDLYELLLNPSLNEDGKEKEKAAEIKSLQKMSAKDITNLLLEKYSINDIRNYMVIKDTIKIQSYKG